MKKAYIISILIAINYAPTALASLPQPASCQGISEEMPLKLSAGIDYAAQTTTMTELGIMADTHRNAAQMANRLLKCLVDHENMYPSSNAHIGDGFIIERSALIQYLRTMISRLAPGSNAPVRQRTVKEQYRQNVSDINYVFNKLTDLLANPGKKMGDVFLL